MSTQSLDTVRCALHRRGLPNAYIQRVVGELEDHQHDIAGEWSVTDASTASNADRMGNPDVLANALADRYHDRTFAGRHPIVTFLLAPIPAVLLAWTALLLVLFGVVQLYKFWFDHTILTISDMSSVVVGVALLMHIVGIVVPPAAIALFFAWLAYRGGKGMIWSCAATALVAFAALCFHSVLLFPIEPGTGMYSVGFGFSPHQLFGPQLLQMLVPILAAALVVLTFNRQRRDLSPM